MNAEANSAETVTHTSTTKDDLPKAVKDKLIPVRTFRSDMGLLATTNLLDLEFDLDPRKAFEVLPITEATEDATTLEFMDPKLLVVKQIGEDGEPQAVVLTPAQVVYLMHKASSVIVLAGGGPLASVSDLRSRNKETTQ